MPTQSRTLKETASRTPSPTHSLRFVFMTHLLYDALMLARAANAGTDLDQVERNLPISKMR